MTSPRLSWDLGTAYDFFVSQVVLHEPAEFGVRGAWAAGVRARVPSEERDMLEQGQLLIYVPLYWIHDLPEPKDAFTALGALSQVPPAERLALLALHPGQRSETDQLLLDVAERGQWAGQDLEAFRAAWACKETASVPVEKLTRILDWWARAEEFGERYLEALRAYHEAFFAEEEKRIRPALEGALTQAQNLAEELALPDLLEELSQGVKFDEFPEAGEWILAPSYWSTPLIIYGKLNGGRALWLFGARPPDESLVPGETVPDAMLRALKALSDPTRLRILRYLAEEPLTPAELARRLRLRAPTVTHHLKTLRLAGLVQLTLAEDSEARRYATRNEALATTIASLEGFVQSDL